MKNDDVDSEILAKLLRAGWIPESYVPPWDTRELRRTVRTRIQIKRSMRSYKNRIRFELLPLHLDYEVDPFTWKGNVFLRNLKSPRIDSYLNVLKGLEEEVKKVDSQLAEHSSIEEVKLLMTIPGIGLFSALLIYSEIGDISRFRGSSKLLAYTGMIPSVRQSADVVHYGHITYQGSRYLRWIIVEAVHSHMKVRSRIQRVEILPQGIKGEEKRQSHSGSCQQVYEDRILGPEGEETLSAELRSIDRSRFFSLVESTVTVNEGICWEMAGPSIVLESSV